MSDVKPFLTYEEQIKKIASHGCAVPDGVLARKVLSQTNYYRFSAYFLPFKQRNGNYKPGTSFEMASRIYEFDRKLRAVLFAAVARIEVLLRSYFAYYHAAHYGPLGYMDSCNFRGAGHDHTRFQRQIADSIDRNKTVLFVQHHIQNYNRQFPVWVIIELFTFGMLSRFYADLKTQDKKAIAKSFNLRYNVLESWLRCLTDFRNNCAHHGRLYFRAFPASPAGFTNIDEKDKRRLFCLMLVLKALYPDSEEWNSEVYAPIVKLFGEYAADINIRHIGFPDDWTSRLKIGTEELGL